MCSRICAPVARRPVEDAPRERYGGHPTESAPALQRRVQTQSRTRVSRFGSGLNYTHTRDTHKHLAPAATSGKQHANLNARQRRWASVMCDGARNRIASTRVPWNACQEVSWRTSATGHLSLKSYAVVYIMCIRIHVPTNLV